MDGRADGLAGGGEGVEGWGMDGWLDKWGHKWDRFRLLPVLRISEKCVAALEEAFRAT